MQPAENPLPPSDAPSGGPARRAGRPGAVGKFVRLVTVLVLSGLLAVGIVICLPWNWDPDRNPPGGGEPSPAADKMQAGGGKMDKGAGPMGQGGGGGGPMAKGGGPAPGAGKGDELRHYPAGAVRFPDDTAVLGVSAGGEHRAYVVKTLEKVESGVVADTIGGEPVVVTYSRSGTGRVFGRAPGGGPPKVRGMGSGEDGRLLLQADGKVYWQATGEPHQAGAVAGGPALPYPEVPSAKTTWAEWARAHPDTSVAVYPALAFGGWLSVFPGWLVHVPDDAAVVGVTVDGQSRAYLLEAFRDITDYTAFDFIRDRPVTATYDPEARRARLFTHYQANTKDPPPLYFAGWRPGGGEMLLDLNGRLYEQASHKAVGEPAGELPYPELEWTQTTWGEWKAAHPDSTMYVGRLRHYVSIPKGGGFGEKSFVERYRIALPIAAALGLVVVFVTGRSRRPA